MHDRFEPLQDGCRWFHRDRSGAVVLLCVAGCMILFMLSLIIWDAGKGARDTLDLQAAADTAARSQASIEARAMNMIAFGNVTKRSIVGLHSMYIGMWMAYTQWWQKRCDLCADQTFTDLSACRDCNRNIQLIRDEGMDKHGQRSDWKKFSSQEFPNVSVTRALEDGNPGQVQQTYRREIESVDQFQGYIADVTPWWSWTEMLVRGTRNGATLTVSFPPPEIGGASSPSNWLDHALGGSAVPGGDAATLNDELPIAKKDVLRGSDRPRGGARDCWQDFATRSPRPITMPPRPPTGEREFRTNVSIHRTASREGGFYEDNIDHGIRLMRTDGCVYSENLFGAEMDPYVLSDVGGGGLGSAQNLMARSQLVFSYGFHPERAIHVDGGGRVQHASGGRTGRDTERFGLVGGSGYGVRAANNPVFESPGSWSISRAEITFPGPGDGTLDNVWMWRAGWTSKLRPVALPGEFDALGYSLNDVYLRMGPYMGVAELLGVTDQGKFQSGGYDRGDTYPDLEAMHRYTRALDSTTIDGFPK